MKKLTATILAVTMLLTVSPVLAAGSETAIVLSDSGTTVDGEMISQNASSAVYQGADIVYYEADQGSSYGEGTKNDEHSAEEAAAHTVITITKAGTYRVSGELSKGQLAIDLGTDAADDPTAVVTLILDGVDLTCTVAPAVIFYNVYECAVVDAEKATGIVDTADAGANVILADGSKNYIDGSYVARIYKEGTTKKLHKYDGAFYSKMSMNISGQALGTGQLHITAANEGLGSELHLTVNGGNIWIESQDDGINTNEDGVSVTTINGGYLWVNGGLGSEGDGIDSNGFLTINGGTIITQAHTMADGGIDADGDILINGGTVIALGGRNDAVSSVSTQPFMELSFASRKQAGTILRIENASGNEVLTFSPIREYQSVTISSPELALNTTYHLYLGGSLTGVQKIDGLYALGGTYSGGIQQQYTGNRQGGFGGGVRAGQPMGTPPEGIEIGQRPDRPEGDVRRGMQPPEEMEISRPDRPEGEMPTGMQPPGGWAGQGNTTVTTEGSVDFVLTQSVRSFSGVSDWVQGSGKTVVSFSVNNGSGILSAKAGETPVLSSVTAKTISGSSLAIAASDVQLTITDVPSESYNESCMLSEGTDGFASILPTDEGRYRLTVSVLSSNETYTGTTQMDFIIGEFPFTDIETGNRYYEAVQFVYNEGLMVGTSENRFAPNESVSRAMAITVFGRLANATTVENNSFSDVVSGSWYSPYVGWAVANSVVSGYGDGKFGPSDTITRQQMCVILYNYAKAHGIDLDSDAGSFTTADNIADWALEAVNACYDAGLLSGITTGGQLNPASLMTRAELADMMMRFAELLI